MLEKELKPPLSRESGLWWSVRRSAGSHPACTADSAGRDMCHNGRGLIAPCQNTEMGAFRHRIYVNGHGAWKHPLRATWHDVCWWQDEYPDAGNCGRGNGEAWFVFAASPLALTQAALPPLPFLMKLGRRISAGRLFAVWYGRSREIGELADGVNEEVPYAWRVVLRGACQGAARRPAPPRRRRPRGAKAGGEPADSVSANGEVSGSR